MSKNELTKKIFDQIVSEIKVNENFVPRDYKTIGGMWTVETWAKEDLKVQVMDEGYTLVLLKMSEENKVEWRIIRNYKDELSFDGISETDFSNNFSKKDEIKKPSKNKL